MRAVSYTHLVLEVGCGDASLWTQNIDRIQADVQITPVSYTHLDVYKRQAIEYTQLVTGRGYCQLDDFVTNTAGAAIGFFIYLMLYAGWLIWKKIR